MDSDEEEEAAEEDLMRRRLLGGGLKRLAPRTSGMLRSLMGSLKVRESITQKAFGDLGGPLTTSKSRYF